MRDASLAVLFVASFAAAAAAACSSSDTPSTPSTSTDGADAGSGADAGQKGQIGDPCPNGSADCADGLECAGEDPGGGQCFKPCAPSKDADCGDTTKYACSDEGHCYVRCTQTSDCPRASQGYVCKDDTPPRPPVKFCDVP